MNTFQEKGIYLLTKNISVTKNGFFWKAVRGLLPVPVMVLGWVAEEKTGPVVG